MRTSQIFSHTMPGRQARRTCLQHTGTALWRCKKVWVAWMIEWLTTSITRGDLVGYKGRKGCPGSCKGRPCMQRKLRGSDIPAATEATLLHAAAFLEFKQHVARRCILAAAVLGRRQKWFLYTSLRQAEFLRDIGGLAHRIILRCVIT